MNNERIEKFLALVSDKTSDFEKKALWRKANKNWLKKSSGIAIKVLRALSDQGISQKRLAEKMEVSAQYINKIVKGSENLSLETISKLETALGIRLIEVVGVNNPINYDISDSVQPITAITSPICKVIPFRPNNYSQSSSPCEESKTA